MHETNNTTISNMPEHLQPTEIEILKTKLQEALLEQERLRDSLLEELDKNAKLIYQNMDLSMEKDRQEAREYKDEESILTALTNVLTNNPKFIDSIASSLADHSAFNQRSAIDYSSLARELELDTLAETIASHFDYGDIAEWVTVDYYELAGALDYSDLSSNIDYSDLAASLDYEDTIRDEVRERMEDLELRNVTVNFS